MRVLHVINTLGPGGAEMNAVRLVQHADRERVEPHLAYCGHWPREAEVQRASVPILRLSDRLRRVKSLSTPLIIGRLARYIRRHRIDLVHTHLYNAHVWGALAARLTHTPVLEHVHDPRYLDRERITHPSYLGMSQFRQAPWFARLSAHTVVLTKQNRRHLVERVGLPPERVSLIPNGIAPRESLPLPEQRERLRQMLGISPMAFVTLAVGRLAPAKNFPMLIDAVGQIANRVPNLQLFILGDGSERTPLQTRIDAAKLGGVVQLVGHQADVQSWYDCADLFLQPSYFELHSLALLEATQAGLPSLVAEGLGLSDDMITPGTTGFILPPDDPTRWAECIEHLSRQPQLRAEIGSRAKAFVETHCDIRSVTKQFERLYEEICGI